MFKRSSLKSGERYILPKIMKLPVVTFLTVMLISMNPILAGADQNAPKKKPGKAFEWQKLAEGLELGIFSAPLPSEIGDSKVRVLRIDTQHYRLRLLNASVSKDGQPLSARQWARQNSLAAAINASMYQADYRSSVSLMLTRAHINNPRLSKDKAILAFDRKSDDVPRVKIIDLQCEDFDFWRKKYRTMIQSIRMISCTGNNVWIQQPQKWSTAAIGLDNRQRVLFIHVGSPYSTHDVIDFLMELPLNITRAMYVEGGPQAQLYVNSGDHEHEFVGNYEIGLQDNMNKLISRPVPNVVGIHLKAAGSSIKKK